RRHTRFSRDWSSDVCSSDLSDHTSRLRADKTVRSPASTSSSSASSWSSGDGGGSTGALQDAVLVTGGAGGALAGGSGAGGGADEIGRASCRERVERGVVDVT